MVTMTVLYPYDAEQAFDEAYYDTRHIALLREVLGDAVIGVTVHYALAGMGADPVARTIAQVEFASMAAFQAAMANPRMAEVRADVANFTTLTPQIQLSRRAS